MATQFIALQEATEPYSKTMQPYKKWFEKIYISSLIEINETLYRNVCTVSRFNRKYLRKVILCTNKGEIVESKQLLQKVFEVLTYLHYFKVFSKNISLDAQQHGEDKFGAVKTSLKKIYHELYSLLSTSEQSTIKEQLNYYDAAIHALDELANLSKTCLELIETLQKLTADDVLTKDFIKTLHDTMIQREKLRNNVEAIILKNGLKVRKSVKAILNNDKYTKQISNNDDRIRVIQEADNAEGISYEIIRSGKRDWKLSEKWFDIDKGKFTVEKYISDLLDINEAKVFLQINTKLITKEHWVYSTNLKY